MLGRRNERYPRALFLALSVLVYLLPGTALAAPGEDLSLSPEFDSGEVTLGNHVVTGSLLDGDLNPVAGREIGWWVFQDTDADGQYIQQDQSVEPLTTAADGSFTITDYAPGDDATHLVIACDQALVGDVCGLATDDDGYLNGQNTSIDRVTCDNPGDDIACAQMDWIGLGDPNDTDDDGVPNDVDNCPDLANADQSDTDADGKGDVCDSHPDVPNPGTDADDDGLSDSVEPTHGTSTSDPDSDDDGLLDGYEVHVHLTDPIDPDTDGDLLIDGDEVNVHSTDPTVADTDGDTIDDGAEVGGGSDPLDPCNPDPAATACGGGGGGGGTDTDGDGLTDSDETDIYLTDPNDPDTDDDTLSDGAEVNTHFTDPNLADTDGDGPDDATDADPLDPCNPDPAATACGGGGGGGGTDTDGDGLTDSDETDIYLTDPNDPDTDDDGLNDGAEVNTHFTDPNDADSDDDGVNDGTDPAPSDACNPDPNDPVCPTADSDSDGLPNSEEEDFGSDPNDPDTDNDGLNDGPEVNTHNTDPTNPDSDFDHVSDGSLDPDGSLPIKAGPDAQPNNPCVPNALSLNCDQDDDGLTNRGEADAGTDPADSDSDNDGLLDGDEFETDPNDADSDNDGLSDGAESSAPPFTDPVDPDSDNDRISDGSADPDGIGPILAGPDAAPNDPCQPSTSAGSCDSDNDGLNRFQEDGLGTSDADIDSDNDGLNDGTERGYGTDPVDPDSDDDGVNDGAEVTATPSTWPDNPDSDFDGVSDGPLDPDGSLGPVTGVSDPAPKNACLPDPSHLQCDQDNDGISNGGEAFWNTDPTDPDTDDDGLKDGEEEFYAGDPTDPDTDNDGKNDGDEVTGTPPTDFLLDPDSDDDGVSDGALDPDGTGPIVAGPDTAPLNPCVPSASAELCDQDNDGLSNREEGIEGTNPTVADSDSDGLKDGFEVSYFMPLNPLDADSDDDGINDGSEHAGSTAPFSADTDGDLKSDGPADPDGTGPITAGPDEDSQDPCVPSVDSPACDKDDDGLQNQTEDDFGSSRTDVDSDDDMLTDGEEVFNFETNPMDADSDGDGTNDGVEYYDHPETDPADPDSDDDGYSDGPADPDPVGPIVANDTAPKNPCVPNPDAVRCDKDRDGLTNEEETEEFGSGTNPNDADSDDDGLSDGREWNFYNSNPNDVDSDDDGHSDEVEANNETDLTHPCDPNPTIGICDRDEDALTNAEEAVLGTDPRNFDTDYDYSWDGQEVARGTDPFDQDTDNDGLFDGDEFSFIGGGGTSPTNPDTDGDLISDGPADPDGAGPIVAGPDGDPTDPCAPNPSSDVCVSQPDSDSDGVFDVDDNCPGTPNPGQEDVDSDGFGNACDPDSIDTDTDGVFDADDNCPSTANAGQGDADHDGIGDACDGVSNTTVGSSTGTSYTNADGLPVVQMGRSQKSDINLSATILCPPPTGGAPDQVKLLYNGIEYPTVLNAGVYSGTIPESALTIGGMINWKITCGSDVYIVPAVQIALYDPSGIITSSATGNPIVGAEVTLYKVPGWTARTSPSDTGANTCESNLSKAPGADWSQPAPTGEGVLVNAYTDAPLIEPDINPFITGTDGRYGWDVAAGCWYIVVEADGFVTETSPVVGVPSEVTDLDIDLTPVIAPRTVSLAAVGAPKKSFGQKFTVAGEITSDDYDCESGLTVELWRDVLGGAVEFTKLTQTTVSSIGSYSLIVTADKSAMYQARVAGSPTCAAASSTPDLKLQVIKKVTLKASAAKVAKGKSVKLTAKILPAHGKEKVTLQQKIGSAWKTIARTTSSSTGVATFTRKITKKSIFRVKSSGHVDHLAGTSNQVTVGVK